MLIELSKIKASPKPIRTTWDEAKMEELAQSIKEQGLIVPIKVRPVEGLEACPLHGFLSLNEGKTMDDIDETAPCDFCNRIGEWMYEGLPETIVEDGQVCDYPWFEQEDDGVEPVNIPFEIVYGHRRVEAARRAGLDEINAIVEGVDDTDALIQALIENVVREDMEPIDTAKAIEALQKNTGWNYEEIERRGIMNARIAKRYKDILREPEEIQSLIANLSPGKKSDSESEIGVFHVEGVRQVLGQTPDGDAVIKKAASEGLSKRDVRKVAESVAATQDPAMRERLINAPYSPYTHDPEMAKERAQMYGAHDPMARDKTPSSGTVWEATTEVKMMLDYLQTSRKMAEEAIKMDEMGKFSPEARAFVARRAKSMISAWEEVVEKLEVGDGL